MQEFGIAKKYCSATNNYRLRFVFGNGVFDFTTGPVAYTVRSNPTNFCVNCPTTRVCDATRKLCTYRHRNDQTGAIDEDWDCHRVPTWI